MPSLSQTQQHFKTIVSDELWPWLSERGFLKRAQTFHRRVGGDWEVINVQRSAFSDRDDIRFTVNLGVAYAQLREVDLERWAAGQRPGENSAHLRIRIGTLIDRQDRWWQVGPATIPSTTGRELTDALSTFGIPWLEARSSIERVAALVADPEQRELQLDDHLRWMRELLRSAGLNDLADAAETERSRQNDALGLWREHPDDPDIRRQHPRGRL